MSSKEIIAKMTGLFDQIGTLTDSLKELKDEAKVAGHDPAMLATIAKAQSEGKSGKLRVKLESILDIMDEQEEA